MFQNLVGSFVYNTARLSITALTLSVTFLALVGSHSAHADTYQLFTGEGDDTCYNMTTYQVVDLSYCSSTSSGDPTAGKTEGAVNALNSAGSTLAGTLISSTGGTSSQENTPTEQWCTTRMNSFGSTAESCFDTQSDAESSKQKCENYFFFPRTCSAVYKKGEDVAHDVSASKPKLSVQGIGANALYSRTVFSDSASGNGTSRISQAAGVNITYAEDFGQWGYSAAMPIMRSINDSAYSVFDSTSIGLAVAPTYHVFREPIHGFGLDVGAVVGLQLVVYDEMNGLRASPYSYTGLDNASSGQIGVFARGSKTVLPKTTLSLGAAFVENRNFVNQGYFGKDTSVTTVDLGAAYILAPRLRLNGDLKSINIAQYSWKGISRNFGEAALGISGDILPQASIGLQASQSFGTDDWSSTGISLNFVWRLN